MAKSYNYQPAGTLAVATTGNIDDLDPQGCGTLLMTNASLATLRGIKAGYPGQIITIYATNAQFNIADQNAGSAAANRIITGNTNTHAYQGTSAASDQQGRCVLVYDDTTARWRILDERTIRFRSWAYTNVGVNLPNNTTTVITFDTNDYDVGSIHSTSVNTSRMTIPVGGAGTWLVDYHVGFVTALNARFLLALNKNGAQVAIGFDLQATPASGTIELNASTMVVNMAEADYLEVTGYQNSGGAINANWSARYTTHLAVQKVD